MTALSSNSPPPGAEPSVLDRLILKFRQVFFPGSGNFWETRYARGGDSGHGSQGRLAQFKAEVLNRFVEQHRVESVIEFGCGDGGQLALLRFPRYIGLDVAPTAIARCRERFRADSSKSFFLYHPFGFE
ncbi:MAG: hypothetical protein GWM98_10685, partial [Nitrospinaceae bacterium]|nr:class I SAM-dependent methyltransferase [Nitrospinaceae bacterium]NIR54869.1 class I SAM-dependent methyltransferase [Nitrospinaceae bacterium]NIS85294.1 class I SAM-dependent methyltransferase [Nitrospinaceae bacterium]NIT82107.1 class I SAM-dependent methyltransferase [Nitrospinaceae bacterium]NIU44368.1 class I SAM-dependent methyltransferase [Nitrospinaceae bacterium]